MCRLPSVRKILTRLRIALLAMMVAGCTTTDPSSHADLRTEVKPYTQEGMAREAVVAGLTALGFPCREGTSLSERKKGIYECTRQRGSLWSPYTCVHRIWFESPAADGIVANARTFDPACAGL